MRSFARSLLEKEHMHWSRAVTNHGALPYVAPIFLDITMALFAWLAILLALNSMPQNRVQLPNVIFNRLIHTRGFCQCPRQIWCAWNPPRNVMVREAYNDQLRLCGEQNKRDGREVTLTVR